MTNSVLRFLLFMIMNIMFSNYKLKEYFYHYYQLTRIFLQLFYTFIVEVKTTNIATNILTHLTLMSHVSIVIQNLHKKANVFKGIINILENTKIFILNKFEIKGLFSVQTCFI